jgi:8-oxo-dGTP diphosphatase
MDKVQRTIVAAFIRKGNRVLIGKRSQKAKIYPGSYELPGGKVEFGEEPKDALKREIREELAVDIKVHEPFHSFSYICHEGKAHHVEIVFLCELNESEKNIRMLDHEDLQWVTRDELKNFAMSEKTRDATERGFDFISKQAT